MFDPELLSNLRERARIQIRARMRALRKAYPEAALGERSARIVERVSKLGEYQLSLIHI